MRALNLPRRDKVDDHRLRRVEYPGQAADGETPADRQGGAVQVVTSNISGKFLPGILIGYATDITVDYHDNLTKSGYLIPAARFDRLQEVLVITDLKDAGPELDE